MANLAGDHLPIRLLTHCNPVFGTDSVKYPCYSGDLLNSDSLSEFLAPESYVINLAYLNRESAAANLIAITNLVRAAKQVGVRRLVHVSTAVVAGKADTNEVTESTACEPVTAYETTKLAIETRLLEEAAGELEVVILRPTAVFGGGGLNLLPIIERMKSTSAWKRYLLACIHGDRALNAVSVRTVVEAIRFVAQLETVPCPPILLVSEDDEPENTYIGVEGRLCDSLSIPRYAFPVIRFPELFLRLILLLRGRSNINPCRRYSPRRLQCLGFRKSTSLDLAINELAATLGAHREDSQR